MRNYLMLLGWAPSGDREIVPWSVIEDEFRLEDGQPVARLLRREEAARLQRRVHPRDVDRGVHRRVPAVADRRGRRASGSRPWAPEAYDPAVFAAVAPLAQTRIALLSEIVPNVDFLFLDRAGAATRRPGTRR